MFGARAPRHEAVIASGAKPATLCRVKKLERLFTVFRTEARHPERPRGMSRFERALFHLVRYYGDALMAKLTDATATLDALVTQVEKIKTEIQALKDAAVNMDTTPEFDAALTRLSTAVQGADDLNADAPTG